MVKVAMIDLETGESKVVFRCATSRQALDVAKEMTRLNEEAARLTGKVIRFIYSIRF